MCLLSAFVGTVERAIASVNTSPLGCPEMLQVYFWKMKTTNICLYISEFKLCLNKAGGVQSVLVTIARVKKI